MIPTEHHARWFGRAARMLKAHGFKVQVVRGHHIALSLIGPRGGIYGHSSGADMCEAVENLLLEIFKPDTRYDTLLSDVEFKRREAQRLTDEHATSYEGFRTWYYQAYQQAKKHFDSSSNP